MSNIKKLTMDRILIESNKYTGIRLIREFKFVDLDKSSEDLTNKQNIIIGNTPRIEEKTEIEPISSSESEKSLSTDEIIAETKEVKEECLKKKTKFAELLGKLKNLASRFKSFITGNSKQIEEKNETEPINSSETEKCLSNSKMVEQLEEIKKKWLKKEIKLLDLPEKLEELASKFKMNPNYEHLKNYIDIKVLLDKNNENSYKLLATTIISLSTLIVSITSAILALITVQLLLDDIFMKQLYFIILLSVIFANLVISIGTFIKHAWGKGKYAREKTFYEMFLKILK